MINYLIATPEQKELANTAREIMEKELVSRVPELDREGRFPVDVLKILAEAGYYGMDIPQRWGGLELDKKTMAIIYEEMAKIDAGFTLSFSVAANEWQRVAATNWTEEEKEAFMQEIIAGNKIGAFCLTEPDAGSDAAAIKTSASQEGDDWIIDGHKCFVTNGPVADYYHVFAWTDRTKSAGQGITLFHVDASTPGVSVGKHEDKMGLRLSETSDVYFDQVRVPSKNIVGELHRGFRIGMAELESARVLNMVFVLGLAQAAQDYAVEYSKVRTTFGKRICDHQGLAFMLADMQTAIDASRALLYYSLDCAQAGIPLGTLSPSTKMFVSEQALKVALDAIQVLGGYGYSREYPVEKLARDAKIFSIFEGTNQIQRMNSARFLVGRPPKNR